MDDRDFFDTLYQGWVKTTGASDTFWMPEPDEEAPSLFNVYAVDKNQDSVHVASGMSEEDAAFITAVHGCFGDLVRRLHRAVDESDRLDLQRDEQECRIAELELEINRLQTIITRMSTCR